MSAQPYFFIRCLSFTLLLFVVNSIHHRQTSIHRVEVSDVSYSWGSNLSCGKSEEKYGPAFNCCNTLMIMLSVLLVFSISNANEMRVILN